MKHPTLLPSVRLAASLLFVSAASASTADITASRESLQTFRFTMANDNPFLNLIPPLGRDDDFGPTQGTGLEYAILRPAGYLSENERWSLQLHSDLYTKDLTPAGQDLFPRVPQAFNEISTLNLGWDDFFNVAGPKRYYRVAGLGVGLVNDSRPNGVLAIGQQTAWHHFKHYQLTPKKTALYDNQLGTTHDFFGTARLGLGRVFSFDDAPRAFGSETNLVKVEAGAELIGIRKGSELYVLAAGNKTLWRSGRTGVGVAAEVRGTVSLNGAANEQSALSVVLDRPTFSVQTGMSFVLGSQNKRLLKYVDRDPIWNLVIEKRWGGARRSDAIR